jgi:hypothetical protein
VIKRIMTSPKKLQKHRVGAGLLALLMTVGTAWFYTQVWHREQPISAIGAVSESGRRAESGARAAPPEVAGQAASLPVEIKAVTARPALNQPAKPENRPVAAFGEVVDANSKLPLRPRLTALRALGLGVNRADWELVRDFVRSPEAIATLNPDQLRYLKNEAMAVLIRADVWLDEAAEVFKAVYADKKQDLGVRDYALQFVAVTAEKDSRVGWDFHWQALQDENKDFASTASLHLLGAAQRGELTKSEQARLAAAALAMASSVSLPATNRATALQVCAELGVREAGKIADRVSRNENEDVIARLSAIAALGRLGGGSETQSYLHALTTGPDKRLQVAATAALERFKLNGG